MNKVLILAVHPDDETLGSGGAILKHKANKDSIHWLICTSVKEGNGFTNKRVLEGKNQIKQAKDMYAFDCVRQLEFDTMQLDTVPKKVLIDRISDIFNEIKPNIVYLPFKDDAHSDHRMAFEAAYSCTKTFRYPFYKKNSYDGNPERDRICAVFRKIEFSA